MFSCIQAIAANNDAKRKVGRADKELCGRGFFEYGFKHRLFDMGMLRKCVSLRSLAGDEPGDGKFAETGEGEMKQSECSYAAPKIGTLLATLGLRGKNKAIALCFDSRNWRNSGKAGALVSWTDGDIATFMDAETALKEHQIATADFDDPGNKLFGKVAPFKHVFEEEECTKAAPKVREEIAKLPSYVEVFKKKGRSWKYKCTPPKDKAKFTEAFMTVNIVEVDKRKATLSLEFADAEGRARLKANSISGTRRWNSRTPSTSAPWENVPTLRK